MVTSWEMLSSTSNSSRAVYVVPTRWFLDRVYEPVEEHRRAAFYALMDRNYGEGAANRSRSRTSTGTSRGSYAERRGSTEGNTGGDSTLPSDIDGIRAVIQDLLESVDQRDVIQDAEAPGEQPCVLPTIQTPQAGPSRTGASPSSQYPTHPHSPEPFDHDLAIGSETREPPTLPLTLPRKTRPFKTSSHSPGNTVWIPQASYEDLPDLPALIPKDEPGTLYVHRNLTDNTLRVWLLGNEKKWVPVQLDNKTQHPTLGDRYLILRSDDTPSWVTLASWNAAKRRVNS